MRPSTLTLACSLLLPCAASATDGSLAVWRAYAQQAVSPNYTWAAAGQVRPPSVLDVERGRLVQRTTNVVGVAMSPFGAVQIAAGNGNFGFDERREDSPLRDTATFQASYKATTLVRPVGGDGALSLTAIAAHQRFATPGFGSDELSEAPPRIGVVRNGSQETATGSGVRLALDRRLGDSLDWSLTLQSRLEMDAFKTYRGVYSEPGDFDIPGFLQGGLRWSPMARTEFGVDVRRVFYSEVDAFTTAALPVRFLALLGDGGSPEFAWRDLTVLSLEAARATGNGGRWSLRYSTQQQPRPTSAVLDRALSDQYSDINVALGFEQNFGRFGELRFAASYSPASYFLGTAPYVQHNFSGDAQYEFDAQWRLRF